MARVGVIGGVAGAGADGGSGRNGVVASRCSPAQRSGGGSGTGPGGYEVPIYWIGSGPIAANAILDDLFKYLVEES